MSMKLHVEILGQCTDSILLRFQLLQRLGLPMKHSLNFSPSQDVDPNRIKVLLIQDDSGTRQFLREQHCATLARKKVDHGEILEEEFNLRERVLRDPRVVRVLPSLIDPDLLGLIDEVCKRCPD